MSKGSALILSGSMFDQKYPLSFL